MICILEQVEACYSSSVELFDHQGSMDYTLRTKEVVERAFRFQKVWGSKWDERDTGLGHIASRGEGPATCRNSPRAHMRPETPEDQEVTIVLRQVLDQPVAAPFLGWPMG